MMKVWMRVGGVAFALLILSPTAGPGAVEAQGPAGRWPLQPGSIENRIVAPMMEGWYANEDGTYSFSFGYLNLNQDVVEIPLGENNFIEPVEFDGMQPTTFHPGRNRGVFAITIPNALGDQDFWWTLRHANGQVTRVPGRTGAIAYQLDWVPRPHGSVPPRVSFDADGDEGRGPPGIVAERTVPTIFGSGRGYPLTWCGPSTKGRWAAKSSSLGMNRRRCRRAMTMTMTMTLLHQTQSSFWKVREWPRCMRRFSRRVSICYACRRTASARRTAVRRTSAAGPTVTSG